MTPQQIDTMKLALEALDTIIDAIYVNSAQEAGAVVKANDAASALREALAQPEQEPVAHCKVRLLRGDESFPKVEIDWVNQPVPGPLYTAPPQRKPLTVWEIELWAAKPINRVALCRAIEAAHGIKETT